MSEAVRVGLLGLGTVGGGVVQVLQANARNLEMRTGRRVELARVLVRDLLKPRAVGLDPGLMTTDAGDILANPEIDIVVEVMGGMEPARDYILEAIRHGKQVVTANKDLMARHGHELLQEAAERHLDLLFEAAVAGGIPIIRPLKECLAGNQVTRLMGIINGTTNYILTKMSQEGWDFDAALSQAQSLGFAEADPTADVEGLDAGRKLAILSSTAFNSRITDSQVFTEGITGVGQRDIFYAHELGYRVKLLAIAKLVGEEVEARVHPALIPQSHPLAAVNGAYNAIFVEGNAVGEAMFYGLGAGALPTASAVVGDIVAATRNLRDGSSGRILCTCYEDRRVRSIGEVVSRYYLRLTVRDQPGVFAGIASVFGNQGVSLASVVQKRTQDQMAEVVLVSHEVLEANLQDALLIIEGLSTVAEVNSVIRVEGGEVL